MNAKQENRFNMYLVVRAYLLTQATVLSKLPFFSDLFDAFQAFIASIEREIEHQSFNKKGVAISKKELKQHLATIAGDNARKLYAYALFIKDQVLQSEMQIPQSILEKKSDAKLKETSEGIYDRAQLHLDDLEAYEITADTQLILRGAIDDFVDSMPSPRLNGTGTTEVTRKMAEDIIGADDQLSKIKATIEIVRLTEPAIYQAFVKSCKVIEYGSRSIAMKALVVDAVTKLSLKGVTVWVKHADGTELQPKLIKKTAAKGGLNVKSLEEGVYIVTLSFVGYVTQTITITIHNGELCKLFVEMSKI